MTGTRNSLLTGFEGFIPIHRFIFDSSRSLEFNLKSRVFCDLFPELKSECEKEIERRKFLAENQAANPQVCKGGEIEVFTFIDVLQEDRAALDSQAVNYGVFGNVVVIGGFAAFAFVVRYVLQTMAALE